MNLSNADCRDANAQLLTYRSQGKLDEHPDVKRLLNEIADLNRKLSGDGEPGNTNPRASSLSQLDCG